VAYSYCTAYEYWKTRTHKNYIKFLSTFLEGDRHLRDYWSDPVDPIDPGVYFVHNLYNTEEGLKREYSTIMHLVSSD
jgi:hypothetical protein